MSYLDRAAISRRMGMGVVQAANQPDPFENAPAVAKIFKDNEAKLARNPELQDFLHYMGRRMQRDPSFLPNLERDLQRNPQKAQELSDVIDHGPPRQQQLLSMFVLNHQLGKPPKMQAPAAVAPDAPLPAVAAAPEPAPAQAEPAPVQAFAVAPPEPVAPPPAPPVQAAPAQPEPSEHAKRIAEYLAAHPGATVRINNADGRKIQESEFFFNTSDDPQAAKLGVALRIDEILQETVKEKGNLRVADMNGKTAFTSNGTNLNEATPPNLGNYAVATGGLQQFTAGNPDYAAPLALGALGFSQAQPASNAPMMCTPDNPTGAPTASINLGALSKFSFGDEQPAMADEAKLGAPQFKRPSSPGMGGM